MSYKLKKLVDPVSYYRLASYVKRNGFKGVVGKFKAGMNELPPQEHYELWFEAKRAKEEDLKRQSETKFEYEPLISILVPTYNTPEELLRAMIDSVIAQSYKNWELCIADGSDNKVTRRILKEYLKKDRRVRAMKLEKNYGISGNTNKALKMARGEFIGLLDHDDTLEPDLLFEVVSALQDRKVGMVYTDEDKLVRKKTDKLWHHAEPIFKPDYSPDLLTSHNYITHFLVVKTAVARQTGGFDSKYDGAQDYDLVLKTSEKILEAGGSVYHIPRILYHWRITEGSTAGNPESKLYCYEAGRTAIEAHLQRRGLKGHVEYTDMWGLYHTVYDTPGNPLLSIIIPNKDHTDDLDKCIASLYEKNSYRNFEVIVVENNSTEQKTFDYYAEAEKKYENLRVVMWKEKEFNYSAINNFGVTFARGDYLLLLNNDTEIISHDALSDMLGILMREDVGIVGAKLLYEDDTVQHAGVVLGFAGYAGHVFNGIGKDDLGYMMRPRINCNYSAVTGACLMTKKSVFKNVGGLTEAFKVAGNDVDYCLKVRQQGLLVVYDAFALLHHYESKSRGYEDTPEKKARFEKEVELFRSYWGDYVDAGDPFYNKNFPVTIAPFTLEQIN